MNIEITNNVLYTFVTILMRRTIRMFRRRRQGNGWQWWCGAGTPRNTLRGAQPAQSRGSAKTFLSPLPRPVPPTLAPSSVLAGCRRPGWRKHRYLDIIMSNQRNCKCLFTYNPGLFVMNSKIMMLVGQQKTAIFHVILVHMFEDHFGWRFQLSACPH